MDDNWLVLAYHLDGNGGGHRLDLGNYQESDSGFDWVHMDIKHDETGNWLHQHSKVDPVVVEALLADTTRPRMLELEQSALAILRGVNLNEDADPEDMVSIRLYLDKTRVISTRKFKLKAVADIEQCILRGCGPKSSGELLSMLAERLCDRMESTISNLSERVDDAEEDVIENPDVLLRHALVEIRKQAILFRRFLSPQRDALAKLKSSALAVFSTMDRRHFQESYDRISRYVEDLDTVRERAQIVQDELTTHLTDKLNKNMYVLSVIAAVFLPLGFLTGLLGINVGGLPGVDDPNAFRDFSVLLVILVTVQVVLFKWRRWF